MTDREVRHLSRRELLELLIRETGENEELRSRVAELEAKLSDRTLVMEQSGSIAEAALSLSNVFAEAQAAADQYLQSIRAREAEMDAMLQKTREKCESMEAECAQKNALLESQTRALCKKALLNAQQKIQELQKESV